MKRESISLILGLALAVSLTGCSKASAPKVTPTPVPSTTPSTVPSATPAPEGTTAPGNYDAEEDGRVEGTDVPDGAVTHGGTRAGNDVKRAIDNTGRVIGRGIENAGDALERAGSDMAGTVR